MHYSVDLCIDLCMHIFRRIIGSDRFFKTRFCSDPTERNHRLKLLPSVSNQRTSDGLPIRRGHPTMNIKLLFCWNHHFPRHHYWQRQQQQESQRQEKQHQQQHQRQQHQHAQRPHETSAVRENYDADQRRNVWQNEKQTLKLIIH